MNKKLIVSILFILSLFLSISFAENCWNYDSTSQATCEAALGGDACRWDSWGKFCMEKGCWDYATNATCTAANSSGCFWQTDSGMGWETGWCQDALNCWNYNTQGTCPVGCLWRSSTCNGVAECSLFSIESTCTNSVFGCWWDQGNYCYKPGSWDYKTKTTCEAAEYTWKTNSYCTQASVSCWNYNNQSACEVAGCKWDGSWCSEKGCWDYATNTTCSDNAKCMWSGSLESGWCTEKDCWSYWTDEACTEDANSVGNCVWEASGTCQNPMCSDFSDNDTCSSKVGCTWKAAACECTWSNCPVYCNDYSSAEETCNQYTSSGCLWTEESCSWKGCWNYNTESSCNVAGGCSWNDDYDYCEELNCWSWDHTNQTACENGTDTYNLDCQWDSYNSICNQKWCGSYTDETACNNSVSGKCFWNAANNWCEEESCWGISVEETCNNTGCSWNSGYGYCTKSSNVNCYNFNQNDCTNTTNNDTCIWDQWSNSCKEKGCWDFYDNTSCLTDGANLSPACTWSEGEGGWCEESGVKCWEYYTNATCVDNECLWDSTWNTCSEKGCWSYWNNDTATGCVDASSGACNWATSSSSGGGWGWCEKRACFNWDNSDEATCENNDYGLNCTWDEGEVGEGWCHGPWQNNCWQYDFWNGGNNATCGAAGCTWENKTGWCYEEMKGFSDFTNEGDCLSSGWGTWNGTNCLEPTGGVSFSGVNPGCWAFDGLPNHCTAIQGCTYNSTSSKCTGLSTEGISCANITNQTMCGKVSLLSTCCKWQAGQCDVSYDKQCWDQMAQAPVGATHCMDYNAVDSPTLCNQIAGDPWFMPCKWNNNTNHCEFKDDMASNIDNVKTKKNCEFLGGTWKTESVCDDSTGASKVNSWCEFSTGSSLYGCDLSCWACNASAACSSSKKGYCVWRNDSSLAQGGYCDIPKDLEMNGDCDKFCGSCEYYTGGGYTPQKACKESQLGCKWDNATSKCIQNTLKSCTEDCFSCFDKDGCNLKGGGSQGTCKWNDFEKRCEPANFVGEICFDGIDNDNNGLIDCNDPSCYFDPFCGGGQMSKNCWVYMDNSSCVDNGCSWFQDPWTKTYRCGMKGESCFTYNNNETGCDSDNNCQWFTETHCEINQTKANKCFTYTGKSTCNADTACKWKADTFSPQGGWCEFGPFECGWNMTLQESKTKCESNSLCSWTLDPWSKVGRCDPKCFAMDSTGINIYNTSTSCNAAISGGLCQWSTGWCEPDTTTVGGVVNSKDCAMYDNDRTTCEQQPGCAWFTQMMMGPMEGSGGGGFMGSQCQVMRSFDCGELKNMSICNTANKNNTFVNNGVYSSESNYGDACRWVNEGSWSWCSNIGEHCGSMYAPFCVDGVCYNSPQLNDTGCKADSACEAINDTYMGGAGACVAACGNSTIQNMSSCQAAGGGTLCVWSGSGGGGGICNYDYCEQYCFGLCPDSCDLTACEGNCSGCGGFGETADAGGGGGMEEGGWCDPIGMKTVFESMESGRPHEIAFDECGESLLNGWADACFLGMKEMPDDYGIGLGLNSMTYAAVCNGETLWDGSTGAGYKTTKGTWYFDTDGDETNGCYSDDNNYTGFEFKFKATWEWSSNGLGETLTARRCLNNSWSAANIALGTNSKKICSEMQGMLITVKKSALANFPTLFKSQYPMRIYAVTGGENATDSNPSDKIGPGYYMPGKVDFKVEDCKAIGKVDMDGDGFYAYEDPDCKYIYLDEGKGFKVLEDCNTPQDDDMNGLINCADPACKNEPVCGGSITFDSTDHEPPTIIKSQKNTHMNSADITYYTNERSNGTMQFYGNDSSCTSLNATLRDQNLWNPSNSNTVKYGFIHVAKVNGLNHTDSLNYTLENSTAYYYKLKVCDISDNCAITGCLNFTTKTTAKTSTIKVDDPDTGESWNINKGTGEFTSMGSACAAATNNVLGEELNPDQVPEIDVKSERASNTSSGSNITLVIGGIDTGSDVVSNLDLNVGSGLGAGTGETEDYVWINESGWGGNDGVYTQGSPSNITLIFPGNDPELWDCENQAANGSFVDCTNITDIAEREYNSTSDETIWVISNPPSDLFSFIVDQSPPSGGGSEETTPSGGSGGGSGGGSSITAYAVKLWLALYPETPVSWSIDKTNIAITQLDISVKNQIRVPKITIENMTEKPSSISAASGKVHQYLNITPQNIAEADLKSVKLTFRVERAWLTDNNIDENTVSLNRYSNGVWNKLATSRTTTEDATYVYYQAETPGFSIFAITGESKVSGEEQGEVTTTTIQTTTTIPSEVSSSEPIKLPIWMPLIIFLIIIVGVGFILKGRINSSKKI